MLYYKFIFYKTYCFFRRMNAYDMPGVKTTLLLGFVMLATIMLLASTLSKELGYNMAWFTSQPSAKALVVAGQLGLWGAHYWVFWRGGRLPTLLQAFEEEAVSLNTSLAGVLTGLFFLVPVGLFIVNAVWGAQVAHP